MASGGRLQRLAEPLLRLSITTLVIVAGASSPSWNHQRQRVSTEKSVAGAFQHLSCRGTDESLQRVVSDCTAQSWRRPAVVGRPRHPVASSVDAKKSVKPLSMAISVLLHDEPISFGGRQLKLSRAAGWFIKRRILSRAKASAALNVEVEARSNRDAMRGRWESISVDFQKTIFDDIQVSGGAFELLGVDLLTLGLLPGPLRRLRRLRRPCEAIGYTTLTDVDVCYSPAIRRLAQHIVNHALRPRAAGSPQAATAGAGATDDGLEDEARQGELEPRVDVLRVRVYGDKLAIEGEMTNGGAFLRVPFRYDFSLSASQDGHVFHFKGASVYWGAPGGHVPLPMLPLQSFKIDLGDRARIEHLRISRGVLTVGGRFILTNIPGFTVAHQSFTRGIINYDLAETLSRVVSNILNLRREW